MRSIQAGTLLFLPIFISACGVTPIKKGGVAGDGGLSYAQVQSLTVGTPAKDVIREFGPPAHQLKKEGRVLALAYAAEDAKGKEQELRIALDDELRVVKGTLAPRKPAR